MGLIRFTGPLLLANGWGRSPFARPAAVVGAPLPDPPHFSTLKPDDTSDGEQYLLSYGQRLVELGLSFGTPIGAWALLQSISDRNAARREEEYQVIPRFEYQVSGWSTLVQRHAVNFLIYGAAKPTINPELTMHRNRRGEPFSLLGCIFRAVLLCFFRRLAWTVIGLGSVIATINIIASVSPTWSLRYSVEPFSLLTHF